MKKNSILEIKFQGLKDFSKEIKDALAKRKPLIQPANQVYFESVATFRKFMTMQKIEILTAIAAQKPGSIYELAKLVDRDFAAVLRDCTSLEGARFIKLHEARNAKKSKTPKLTFDYSCILINLPKNAYQIEFKVAA